jgi:hypothetical protein
MAYDNLVDHHFEWDISIFEFTFQMDVSTQTDIQDERITMCEMLLCKGFYEINNVMKLIEKASDVLKEIKAIDTISQAPITRFDRLATIMNDYDHQHLNKASKRIATVEKPSLALKMKPSTSRVINVDYVNDSYDNGDEDYIPKKAVYEIIF